MNSPERVLLNYIKDNWSLTDSGVTKQEVVFTDKDVNTDKQTYAPHVIVQQAGAQRKQPEEDALYTFTFIVKVYLWSRWSKFTSDTDTRLLHWKMVDHIKKMFSINPPSAPSEWRYAYVESTSNVALSLGVPDLNEFNIVITAVIPWI